MKAIKKLVFSILFIFFFLNQGWSQQKPNAFNPYLTNAEIVWLIRYDIDLTQKKILNRKLQKNLKEVFDLRDIERRKRAEVAAFGVIGIMGIAAGLSNVKTSFTSQSINSIMSAVGIISTGIAFKKFFERKNATKQLKQQIIISKDQYDSLLSR